MRRRITRGFTLIEMMVVIAIIGLLSIMFIALSARTYGTNADSISDTVAADLMFARSRAISTRRWHKVEITPQNVVISQSTVTPPQGMVQPPSTAYAQIQSLTVPNGTTIWDAQTGIDGAGTFTVATPNAAVDRIYYFRPDGSSTGGTILVADATGARKFRVLVYTISGGVYSRPGF